MQPIVILNKEKLLKVKYRQLPIDAVEALSAILWGEIVAATLEELKERKKRIS